MSQPTALFSDTFDLPLTDIHADPARFQGRLGEYSEDTVNAIVGKGHYDRSKSPITVWRDPVNGKFYILSGHSRFEAAKRIYATGKQPELASLPVKQMMVDDVTAAIEYAVLESNRKSTEEGLVPDIMAYRKAVELGKNSAYLKSIFRPDSRFQRLKELSKLNPKGMFIEQLAAASQHSFPYLERNARWVGNMRAQFPALTDLHERELFDYLYGSKKALNITKQQFFDLVNSKVSRIDFDPANALNLANRISPTAYTDPLNEQLREIDKDIAATEREIQNLRTALARAKSEGIAPPLVASTNQVGRITMEARIGELNNHIVTKYQAKAKLQQDAGRLERTMGGDLFSMMDAPAPAPTPVVERQGAITEDEKMQFGTGYKDYDFERADIPTNRLKITEFPSLSDREDLIADIKKNGIKKPIVVVADTDAYDANYYVMNGNHRTAIAKHLNMGTVPALIATQKEAKEDEKEVKMPEQVAEPVYVPKLHEFDCMYNGKETTVRAYGQYAAQQAAAKLWKVAPKNAYRISVSPGRPVEAEPAAPAPKSTVDILRQLNARDPEKRKEAKAAMKPSYSPTSIVNPKTTPSQKVLETLSSKVDTKPGYYYVSAVIGGTAYPLLGPFVNDHQAALDCVDEVANVARNDNSGRGVFASYGTMRTEKGILTGKLNKWWADARKDYPQPSAQNSPDRAHQAAMAAVKEVVNDVKAGRAFTSFNEIKKDEVVIFNTGTFGSALVHNGNKVFFTENGTPVRPKLKDIRRPRPDEQEKVDKVLIGQFIPEYYLKHPQYKGNPIERQLKTVTLYPWNRVVSDQTPDKAIIGRSIFYDGGELSSKKESSYYVVLGKTIQRIGRNANAEYVSIHTPDADYRLANNIKLYEVKPMFKRGEGTMVKLKDMVSTKQNPERSYIVATARMSEAAHGDGEPRGPLNVERMPDGRYHVKDGNATFEVARRAGWAQLPVIIDNDPDTEILKKKKMMAMKAKAAAARARALSI